METGQKAFTMPKEDSVYIKPFLQPVRKISKKMSVGA
jgi:hypothetical protein